MEHLGCTTLFVIAMLVYLIYLKPKLEDRAANKEFDDRVLGFIDGLYLADVPFKCPAGDMRSYVRRNLAGAHKLPDNESLLNYTAANGYRYTSHTGSGDHILFAILCLVRYADETSNAELLAWCEDNLETARKGGIGYNLR